VGELTGPQPLTADHDASGFDCGDDLLNGWLRQRGLHNQLSGASRTFVACAGQRVVAYYSLSATGVSASSATGRFRRNMPDPIPVVLLGRLAVDREFQGLGMARGMIRDAVLRVSQVAEEIGIRGLVVQAIDRRAQALYIHLGFTPSPDNDLLLMITLADAKSASQP
jgi:GNAT superfamily N-acetyltransferase